MVVRTDPTVTEVWYKILDGDPTNDDSATGSTNGNGVWVQATQLTAYAVDHQYLPERVAVQLQQHARPAAPRKFSCVCAS